MHTWRTLEDGGIEVDGQIPVLARALVPRFVAMVNRWGSLIQSEAERAGVPAADVAAIMWTETKGQLGLTSSAGARGPMQVMPFNFPAGTSLAQMDDPAINIRRGTEMLAASYKAGADLPAMASIYNAGGGPKTPRPDSSNPWNMRQQHNDAGWYIDQVIEAANFMRLSSAAKDAYMGGATSPSSSSGTVIVLGDSIAGVVAPKLAAALPGTTVRVASYVSQTISSVAAHVSELEGADVGVLVAGANDVPSNDAAAVIAEHYFALAAQAATRVKRGVVVVLVMPNGDRQRTPAARAALVPTINARVTELLANRWPRKGPRVVVVDTGLELGDLRDGVHPNDAGATKAARAIAAACRQLLSGARSSSSSSSAGVAILLVVGYVAAKLLKWW